MSRRKFRVNTQNHQKINKNFVKTAEDYNDDNNVNKQLVRFDVLLLLYHMCTCVCYQKCCEHFVISSTKYNPKRIKDQNFDLLQLLGIKKMD